jgi:hypothetical protein
MARITISNKSVIGFLLIKENSIGVFDPDNEDNTILIQVDWDYPGIAQSFGWSLTAVQKDGEQCDHSGTDGTITCPECGLTPTDFISAASEWLYENEGIIADDPGYFAD